MNVLTDSIRLIGKSLASKSPVLMTGTAVAGVFVTAGLAIQATPKAMKAVEEARNKKGAPLTRIETLKVAGPHYTATGVSALLTSASMVLSTTTSLKRNNELAACIIAGQSAASDYQLKIIDAIGEDKEKEIRDKAITEKISQTWEAAEKNALGSGKILCYDVYSDRYFWSDIETIRRGLNDFNESLIGSIAGKSLNDFYEYVTPLDNISYGDMLGFNPENGCVELRYSTLMPPSGIPCLTIEFRTQSMPKLGYGGYIGG